MATRFGTSDIERGQPHLLDAIDDPLASGVGGNGAEEVGLVAQRAEAGEAVVTVGDHHREVAQHLARAVHSHVPKDRRARPRQGTGETQTVGQFVEQQAARVVGDTLPIGADQRAAGELATLHSEGAPCTWGFQASTPEVSLAQAGTFIFQPPRLAPTSERSGLVHARRIGI
jgi:hypothetical protein